MSLQYYAVLSSVLSHVMIGHDATSKPACHRLLHTDDTCDLVQEMRQEDKTR